jgi:hypothetical protein
MVMIAVVPSRGFCTGVPLRGMCWCQAVNWCKLKYPIVLDNLSMKGFIWTLHKVPKSCQYWWSKICHSVCLFHLQNYKFTWTKLGPLRWGGYIKMANLTFACIYPKEYIFYIKLKSNFMYYSQTWLILLKKMVHNLKYRSH